MRGLVTELLGILLRWLLGKEMMGRLCRRCRNDAFPSLNLLLFHLHWTVDAM